MVVPSREQTKNPFLSLKFDEVIMYDFQGGKGSDLSIVEDNGKLAKSVTKQALLDNENISKLNSKLGDPKSYGCTTAACFEPHLGFVYYLKDTIVAFVTICLDCNRLVSSLDINAQKQGQLGQGEDAYYTLDGLSGSFREFLNQLLIKNNFSHQVKEP